VRKYVFVAAFIAMLMAAACVRDLVRTPAVPPSLPQADLIVVEKAAHRMMVFRQGRVQQVYTVALGRGGTGPKTISGDNKVPEGAYRIVGRNPRSAFHLSLRIGYPTRAQAQDALRKGVDPGGDVMIHGIRKGLGWVGSLQNTVDWTRGCIAVTNSEIEEVWRNVPDGTRIIIKP